MYANKVTNAHYFTHPRTMGAGTTVAKNHYNMINATQKIREHPENTQNTLRAYPEKVQGIFRKHSEQTQR